MSSFRQKWNQVCKYFSSFRAGPKSRFYPDAILMEPTSSCNLKCIHCYRESQVHRDMQLQNRNMSLETFERVLQQLQPLLRRITFAGYGEPLINPELPTMTRLASGQGISMRMISNGLLWNEERTAAMLEAGIDQVCFSLDAATGETYKKVRQGDWERAVAGVRLFAAERQKRDRQPGFFLYHVLNANNMHETAAMVRMGYEMKADSISFAPVRTEGILPTDELTLERQDREKLLEHLRRAIDEDKDGLTNLCDIVAAFEHEETPHRPGTQVCYSPWTDIMVVTDGTIEPCCNYFGLAGKYSLGNINEQSFQEIWNGEAYKKFRSDFVHNHVCDWCRLYPGIDKNKVHQRLEKFRSTLPFMQVFSQKK